MALSASRIACVSCEKTFAFRSGLSRHMKKHHSDEQDKSSSLGCHLCDSRSDYSIVVVNSCHEFSLISQFSGFQQY